MAAMPNMLHYRPVANSNLAFGYFSIYLSYLKMSECQYVQWKLQQELSQELLLSAVLGANRQLQ